MLCILIGIYATNVKVDLSFFFLIIQNILFVNDPSQTRYGVNSESAVLYPFSICLYANMIFYVRDLMLNVLFLDLLLSPRLINGISASCQARNLGSQET